jgi:uncharacterized protein (UPF0305 family)
MVVDDISEKTDFQFQNINMSEEQEKDSKVQELKDQILKDKAPAASKNKHILIEDALYYILDVNGDPMKPIIYLFPGIVVGYGPLTSTPM